ncbi:MAG: enoyl-CoA hydratase/isomerase family protein [Deltaproteobacteria bacterium]|nr:enoyl-CoA hydratase/isomerase family protein [Deltaproteobacteria bacterium]
MALPPLSVLTCRVQGNVARIGLNRPDVRNAINKQVVDELLALLDALASDPSVAVVVLAGEGKLFASGADIGELRARRSPDALRAFNARLFQAVEDFPRPTIAAIHGFALGGGLELALACDLRVAARSAKLGLPEVGLGIYPAAGGTWRLPRLIGLGKAKELVFTGRILDGQQAHELGLVELVCVEDKLEATALELASEIAQHAPMALQVAKLSFQAAARGGDPTVAERLGQALLFDSEEKERRMTAFLDRKKEKRP